MVGTFRGEAITVNSVGIYRECRLFDVTEGYVNNRRFFSRAAAGRLLSAEWSYLSLHRITEAHAHDCTSQTSADAPY